MFYHFPYSITEYVCTIFIGVFISTSSLSTYTLNSDGNGNTLEGKTPVPSINSTFWILIEVYRSSTRLMFSALCLVEVMSKRDAETPTVSTLPTDTFACEHHREVVDVESDVCFFAPLRTVSIQCQKRIPLSV